MLLNVFDSDSLKVITIDSSELNPEVHFHLVTQEKFSSNDLDSFGYVAPSKKKKAKEVVEAPVEEVVEEVVE